MDPLTPLDTLCRIILRAREYEAQTPTDYDGNEAAENVDDESEGTLSVLDDTINDSVEEELTAAFEDLGEDQLAEVVGFCWVGAGTYEAADWDEAIEEAPAQVGERSERELVGDQALAVAQRGARDGQRPDGRDRHAEGEDVGALGRAADEVARGREQPDAGQHRAGGQGRRGAQQPPA